jgi:hypothetical protein
MSSSNGPNELVWLKRCSYWRDDDGRVVVEAWRRSGLPLATFARHHGLGETRMRWWRNRLDEPRVRPPSTSPTLIPVTNRRLPECQHERGGRSGKRRVERSRSAAAGRW